MEQKVHIQPKRARASYCKTSEYLTKEASQTPGNLLNLSVWLSGDSLRWLNRADLVK